MDLAYRTPYLPKTIKDLAQKDYKVVVQGMIINKQEGSFFIDDGTGQLFVTCQHPITSEKVRVFGKLTPHETGFELKADAVQDFTDMDKELHDKVIGRIY